MTPSLMAWFRNSITLEEEWEETQRKLLTMALCLGATL